MGPVLSKGNTLIMQVDEELRQTLDLPHISQICIVVHDLGKTVDYYEKVLGLGPFVLPEIHYDEKTYMGKPIDSEWVMGFCSLGAVELELSQSLGPPNAYHDFLQEHGEGLHHIGFDVPDMDARIERYEKLGIRVLMSGRTATGGFAHLDTTEVGGVIVELIQRVTRRVP